MVKGLFLNEYWNLQQIHSVKIGKSLYFMLFFYKNMNTFCKNHLYGSIVPISLKLPNGNAYNNQNKNHEKLKILTSVMFNSTALNKKMENKISHRTTVAIFELLQLTDLTGFQLRNSKFPSRNQSVTSQNLMVSPLPFVTQDFLGR